jgi:hypothetical protein
VTVATPIEIRPETTCIGCSPRTIQTKMAFWINASNRDLSVEPSQRNRGQSFLCQMYMSRITSLIESLYEPIMAIIRLKDQHTHQIF